MLALPPSTKLSPWMGSISYPVAFNKDLPGALSPTGNQKLFALAGILAPIIFTAVVIILAALRPDYSHVSQPMSQLGEIGGPNAIVMKELTHSGRTWEHFSIFQHK